MNPDLVTLYRERFVNRPFFLRVNMFQNPYVVVVKAGGIDRPSGTGRDALFAAGEPIRIDALMPAETHIDFTFHVPDRSRSGKVRFKFEQAIDPNFGGDGGLQRAVDAIFSGYATRAPPKPDEDPGQDPAAEVESEDEPLPQSELSRLLVETSRSNMAGDGDQVATIVISARDFEGRLMTQCSGSVRIRVNAGRLSASEVAMRGGLARVNLQVPILDDENQVMQRSVELTDKVIRKMLRASPDEDPRKVAEKAAREGPNTSSLSTLSGDEPWVFIVAEYEGVKGKAKIQLSPALATAVSGIQGVYKGDDITGSTSWTYDSSTGILMQDGSPDEIDLEWTGESHMGFYGVSVGGMETSAVLLPGKRFYLVAPPIMFNQVDLPSEETHEEKPKPKVALTARQNPIAADGLERTELLFSYQDEKGKPHAGIKLDWQVDPHREWPQTQRGRLAAADSRTNARGEARAIYIAPKLNQAQSMQSTGTVKMQDVSVTYEGSGNNGQVTCRIGLLRSASVYLVVDKPGVARSRLPVKLGSLNGTVKGQVLLRVTRFKMTGMPGRIPLNDARITLEGDEKILAGLPFDPGMTDEEGRFTLKMRLGSWPKWNKELSEPMLVPPSAQFLARQQNASRALDLWSASNEVRLQGREFILSAQSSLAELEGIEAEGLGEKMEVFAWMLLVLKDSRRDAHETAGELLDHGSSLLMGVASYFYADSRLDKAIRAKYKILERSLGLRKLKLVKLRWERSQRLGTSATNRIHRFLSKWILGSRVSTNSGQGGRFTRSTLNQLILPQLVKQLSDALAQYLPSMTNFKLIISERLLQPYADLGDQYLLLLLNNRDLERIHHAYIPIYAKLSTSHGTMARNYQKITQWRIAEMYLQTFMDTVNECGQVALTIVGVVFLQPEIVEAANKLDKIHKALSTATAGARFGEECNRFANELDKTLETLLHCLALTTDDVAVAQLESGLRGKETFPVMKAGIGFSPNTALKLPLADFMDWSAFKIREGRVQQDVLPILMIAEVVVDDWVQDAFPGLLGVADQDEDGMETFLSNFEEWLAKLRSCRAAALTLADHDLSEDEQEQWTRQVTELKKMSASFQDRLDGVNLEIEALGPAPDEILQTQIASAVINQDDQLKRWLPPITLVLAVIMFLVGIWMMRKRGIGQRRSKIARAQVGVPLLQPDPFPSLTPHQEGLTPVGPRLVDQRGVAIPLQAECSTLGSATDNSIVIAIHGVSRHHARILRSPQGQYWVEDLNSTNGVKLGDSKVDRAWLVSGAQIQLGQWTARFYAE